MKKLLLTFAALAFIASPAFADGYDLTVKSIDELAEDTAAPASGDFLVRYDSSADAFKKVDATNASVAVGSDSIVDISADTTLTCTTNGDGHINYVSAASGTTNVTITAPAATGTGCLYEFFFPVAPNSAATETGDILQVTGDDSFNGLFEVSQDGGSGFIAFETTSDTDQITFSSVSGGQYSRITIQDVGTDIYAIMDSALIGAGTEATPGATGQRP